MMSPHCAWQLLTGPADEPWTVDQLVQYARVPAGDEEDVAMMQDFLRAARTVVEQDTGLAMTTQTIDVAFDWLPVGRPVPLPRPPLQAIETFVWYDTSGIAHDVNPVDYRLDTVSMPARLVWIGSGATDARAFQPWRLALRVGYVLPSDVPAGLRHAVLMLASHYLMQGRDLAVVGTIAASMPMGYDDAIQPFRLVTVM